MGGFLLKCAGCALIALTLSSCSAGSIPFSGSKQVNFDTGYTVNADISCGEFKAKADITRKAENSWEFQFTEPKQLMGMKLSLDDGVMTAKLGSFSISADDSGVYNTLPKIISQAVDTMPDMPAESLTEEEGVLTAETEFNGQRVVITAAKDTGNLISLKCPYYKLTVHFSEQAKLGDLGTEEVVIIEE